MKAENKHSFKRTYFAGLENFNIKNINIDWKCLTMIKRSNIFFQRSLYIYVFTIYIYFKIIDPIRYHRINYSKFKY